MHFKFNNHCTKSIKAGILNLIYLLTQLKKFKLINLTLYNKEQLNLSYLKFYLYKLDLLVSAILISFIHIKKKKNYTSEYTCNKAFFLSHMGVVHSYKTFF